MANNSERSQRWRDTLGIDVEELSVPDLRKRVSSIIRRHCTLLQQSKNRSAVRDNLRRLTDIGALLEQETWLVQVNQRARRT